MESEMSWGCVQIEGGREGQREGRGVRERGGTCEASVDTCYRAVPRAVTSQGTQNRGRQCHGGGGERRKGESKG